MELTLLQIIGYVASIIIAISMTMNSIVKFRWINLVGAITFSTYGFIIGAYPVGFLNGFIVAVDIYYLYLIYSKKESFEILEVRPDNKYLLRFVEFHNNDIQKHFPGFTYKPELNTLSFLILRNMAVAGVFLSHKEENDVLRVGLDYVIPEYRDFKNGKYIYFRLKNRFTQSGIKRIVSDGNSKTYSVYLRKQGFKETGEGKFEKNLI
jgi:hypothetical protein